MWIRTRNSARIPCLKLSADGVLRIRLHTQAQELSPQPSLLVILQQIR
jgi:hypothetical protein